MAVGSGTSTPRASETGTQAFESCGARPLDGEGGGVGQAKRQRRLLAQHLDKGEGSFDRDH
jgi:hypothetical protein